MSGLRRKFGADRFEIPLSPSPFEQFGQKVAQTNALDLSCSNPMEFLENFHAIRKYLPKPKNCIFLAKIEKVVYLVNKYFSDIENMWKR